LSPTRRHPLMGSASSSEYGDSGSSRISGSLLPPRTLWLRDSRRSPASLAVFLPEPLPGHNHSQPGSTSRELSLPYRVLPETLPLPHTLQHRNIEAPHCSTGPEGPTSQDRDNRLSWGLAPSSRAPRTESTCRTASHCCATFRPRPFSDPRRLPPRHASRPCFMPLPRTGFLPTGTFPPWQPYRLVTGLCPPVVYLTSLRSFTRR
jgi:hypothetical protein